jgi:hypothetical protein
VNVEQLKQKRVGQQTKQIKKILLLREVPLEEFKLLKGRHDLVLLTVLLTSLLK